MADIRKWNGKSFDRVKHPIIADEEADLEKAYIAAGYGCHRLGIDGLAASGVKFWGHGRHIAEWDSVIVELSLGDDIIEYLFDDIESAMEFTTKVSGTFVLEEVGSLFESIKNVMVKLKAGKNV